MSTGLHYNPVYDQRFKLPKYNGPQSVFSAHGSDAGKIARKLFPAYGRAEHASVADEYRLAANKAKNFYAAALDDAAMRAWGRPFRVTDYRISGIGSDEFSERDKNKLRKLVAEERSFRKISEAHEHAAKSIRRTNPGVTRLKSQLRVALVKTASGWKGVVVPFPGARPHLTKDPGKVTVFPNAEAASDAAAVAAPGLPHKVVHWEIVASEMGGGARRQNPGSHPSMTLQEAKSLVGKRLYVHVYPRLKQVSVAGGRLRPASPAALKFLIAFNKASK